MVRCRCRPTSSGPGAAIRATARMAGVAKSSGEPRLFTRPDYQSRPIDLLLTNFHLPHSTLLMLVAALVGLPRIKAAYAHAIAAGYRFFSYGDACLIEAPAGYSLSAPGGGEGWGEVGDSRALADTHLTLPALRAGPLPLPPEGRRGVNGKPLGGAGPGEGGEALLRRHAVRDRLLGVFVAQFVEAGM